MNKFLQIFAVAVLLSILVFGCGSKDYNAMQEKHAAVKTYRDGKWGVRYEKCMQEGTDRITKTMLYLSLNAEQELTEQEMLDIMDYYEFTRNAQWDANNRYMGERETDYVCYAVFYEGETDQEFCRIKYCNGEEVEIPEEEQSYFPASYVRNDEEDMGEDGINGSLP